MARYIACAISIPRINSRETEITLMISVLATSFHQVCEVSTDL
jgi:hypothetical protein